jgi:hypothetical protein
MPKRRRVVAGVLAAGALVMATQDPASANSEWIVTDWSYGAVNAGALHDGWYQVYIESRIYGACSSVQVSYDGSGGWIPVKYYGTTHRLMDCYTESDSTLLYTGTNAVFFRVIIEVGMYPPVTPAKAVYDDH